MLQQRWGGIYANNTNPAEFIYDNLMIECNIINGAHRAEVEKWLFLGSSCIYPCAVPQPMCEDALMTGVLEPTNEPYAIAKLMDVTRLRTLGWQASTGLEEGLRETHVWFVANQDRFRS